MLLRRMLSSNFDMKDLGVADLILGVRIIRTPQGLTLSQSHYIEKVLDKFNYLNFNVVKTQIDLSCTFKKMKVKVTLNWNMSECWEV